MKVPGIDVNYADKSEVTALIWASIKGHVEIVKELLFFPEINVNHANKEGDTALMIALKENKLECVKELENYYDNNPSLKKPRKSFFKSLFSF